MSEKLKALKERGSTHFWGNKEPRCPHCGEEIDIARFDLFSLYDESDTHEIECPLCDESFTVKASASWSFDTSDQEEE